MKENSKYLATHAHGMITTSDTLRKSLEDANKDGLGRLEGALDELLKRFTTVLTHRQMLHREREKCIKLMDVKVLACFQCNRNDVNIKPFRHNIIT